MPGPDLNLPTGACCSVKIIDDGTKLGNLPLSHLVGPPIVGVEVMPTNPSYSFLIEGPKGRKILFDLGVRPDWQSLAPIVSNRLKSTDWQISAETEVIDILVKNGLEANDIEAIIWSHWHWDHLGDPSKFPKSTDLIVGPGFKKAFLPGYPAGSDSPILETDYDGRNIVEIDFMGLDVTKVGRMNAYDYFGDSSFYLLDTPGHAIGHLCGLARTTTNPDTYILMAGDAIHHAGELRPSVYLPIPEIISPHPVTALAHTGPFCPGHVLDQLQEARGRKPAEPFFIPKMGHDIPEALHTINKLQDADWNNNVFVIFAHDNDVRNVVEYMPNEANRWKEKGWGQKARWGFLKDFMPALFLDG